MKKLLAMLLCLLLCLPALAEEPETDDVQALLAPFAFTLPAEVQSALAPGEASVSFVHENGSTRAVAMVLSRVPDENGDHHAELEKLMAQFSPNAQSYTVLGLTENIHSVMADNLAVMEDLTGGCYGLIAVTPGALEGLDGLAVDQVTVMVLWQSPLNAELLIISAYDMSGNTESAHAMVNLLLRAATINDAPVVPVVEEIEKIELPKE